MGGGLELALSCDFRYVDEKATFGLPETKIGIFPAYQYNSDISAGGTQRLPAIVGTANAKELIFTGKILDAQRAEKIGLVDKVSGNIEHDVFEFSQKLSQSAPIGMKLAKKAIDYNLNQSM